MKKETTKVNSANDTAKKETAVQSIRRAAEILDCISAGINSVTEIAVRCNLSKSTVHRLLKALGESELVMQDTTNHQYFLGYAIIKLISTPMTTQEYLTTCAAEEMNHLSEITGETVSLGVKMGLKNINIHVVTSKSDLKVDGSIFRMRPIHHGIDGYVLLSQLDDHQIANIFHSIRLEMKTKREKINSDEIISRINQIRQQGFAVSHGELILGATCISVPIRNYALPAVLNLVGPEIRMKPRIETLIAQVIECAGRISATLTRSNDSNSVR